VRSAAGGSVVVHCNMGMSRSASVVIGYLIRRQRWSYERAYMHTKLLRAIISPNAGFESVLQEMELDYAPAAASADDGTDGAAAAAAAAEPPAIASGSGGGVPNPPAGAGAGAAEWQRGETVSDSHSVDRTSSYTSSSGPAEIRTPSRHSSAEAGGGGGGELVRTYTPEQRTFSALSHALAAEAAPVPRHLLLLLLLPSGLVLTRPCSLCTYACASLFRPLLRPWMIVIVSSSCRHHVACRGATGLRYDGQQPRL
jgi:hypothetical protein